MNTIHSPPSNTTNTKGIPPLSAKLTVTITDSETDPSEDEDEKEEETGPILASSEYDRALDPVAEHPDAPQPSVHNGMFLVQVLTSLNPSFHFSSALSLLSIPLKISKSDGYLIQIAPFSPTCQLDPKGRDQVTSERQRIIPGNFGC